MTRRLSAITSVSPAESRSEPSATRSGDDFLVAVPTELVQLIIDGLAARIVEQLPRQWFSSRPESPYLSVEEAAERMRCSRQRVYDLLSARRLSRYRDGSRVLVSRAELDSYLAGGGRR